jgi:diacylglycerol kinase (ATP)
MLTNSPPIALLNPNARCGRAARSIEHHLAKLPNSCEITQCQTPAETEATAHAAALRNAETIIAIGGDGTIHHVANGILSAPQTTSALAIIPSGTANDYWATLQTYTERARSNELLVDVGQLRQGTFQRFFINALGIGFSAETAAAAQNYKKWPPRFRYLLGVFESLRQRWSLTPAELQLDNHINNNTAHEANLLLLSIAKGRREGSFTLAPKAQLDDSQLHILTAKNLRRRDVLRYLPGVCIGKLPTTDPRIEFQTCRQLRLRPQQPLRFHLDGELFGDSYLTPTEDAHVALHPKKLRIKFVT